MGLFQRISSLDALLGALALVYPSLEYVPIGGLLALGLLAGGFWVLKDFASGPSKVYRNPPAKVWNGPTKGLVGQTVRDFEFTDLRGDKRLLSSMLGGSPALLYLYSPYCGHCSSMLPAFGAWASGLSGVPVIGVQWQGTPSTMAAARNAAGTLLADPKGEFCGSVGVGEFTAFVIDSERVIRLRSNGYDTAALGAALGALNSRTDSATMQTADAPR